MGARHFRSCLGRVIKIRVGSDSWLSEAPWHTPEQMTRLKSSTVYTVKVNVVRRTQVMPNCVQTGSYYTVVTKFSRE